VVEDFFATRSGSGEVMVPLQGGRSKSRSRARKNLESGPKIFNFGRARTIYSQQELNLLLFSSKCHLITTVYQVNCYFHHNRASKEISCSNRTNCIQWTFWLNGLLKIKHFLLLLSKNEFTLSRVMTAASSHEIWVKHLRSEKTKSCLPSLASVLSKHLFKSSLSSTKIIFTLCGIAFSKLATRSIQNSPRQMLRPPDCEKDPAVKAIK